MSNEQLFFGLSQGLRKFPKETGKQKWKEEIIKEMLDSLFISYGDLCFIYLNVNLYNSLR